MHLFNVLEGSVVMQVKAGKKSRSRQARVFYEGPNEYSYRLAGTASATKPASPCGPA